MESLKESELVIYVCQSSDKKVTRKVALSGYAYTKRGERGQIGYWYCDQRKICSASLIEREGTFTPLQEDKYGYRRSKRGWGDDGQHSTHLPDYARIEKEISVRVKRLEKKERKRKKTEEHTITLPSICSAELQEISYELNDSQNDRVIEIINANYVESVDVEKEEPRNYENPVLIDTDGGIYDAWALSLALASTKAKLSPVDYQIVGITTVNGATSVSNAATNVSRVFQEAGAPPIPLFRGMESSIIGQPGTTSKPSFFGSDGFGDTKDLPPLINHTRVEQEHSVNAIVKLAERYKGRLTIIALGPLTNLAMAVKMKPAIKNLIKEIFIMGGNMDGVGNMTVTSEFNFNVDPEAANIVLENFHSCPIYLLPWETCMRSAASTFAFRTQIGKAGNSMISFLNKIEGNILRKHGEQWIAPEAVIIACFLNREIIRKMENYHCTVELQGKHTRGMMIVDRNFLRQNPANVAIITEVDRVGFEKLIVAAMTDNPSAFSMNEKYF